MPTRTLSPAEKEVLAQETIECWCAFQDALSPNAGYPKEEFDAFFRSAWSYCQAIRYDKLVHRQLAGILAGLGEQLGERTQVPPRVSRQADRLDALFFWGDNPDQCPDESPEL